MQTTARKTGEGLAIGMVRPGTDAEPPSLSPQQVTPLVRNTRTPAILIGAGFIAGAVFCLAVGLVRTVPAASEQAAHEASTQTVAATKAAALTNLGAPELPTIYIVDPVNCSALQLNRETNRTELRPCPSSGLALRLDPQTGPEDMAGLTSTTAQAASVDAN